MVQIFFLRRDVGELVEACIFFVAYYNLYYYYLLLLLLLVIQIGPTFFVVKSFYDHFSLPNAWEANLYLCSEY